MQRQKVLYEIKTDAEYVQLVRVGEEIWTELVENVHFAPPPPPPPLTINSAEKKKIPRRRVSNVDPNFRKSLSPVSPIPWADA